MPAGVGSPRRSWSASWRGPGLRPSRDQAGTKQGPSGACPASQDSRATHRGALLSELAAHGHTAAFEPRRLAAGLSGMCDVGGVSLLRVGMHGGNVRRGLAGASPTDIWCRLLDGSKDGGCSSTLERVGAATRRPTVTPRAARAALARAQKTRSGPTLSATRWHHRPPRSKGDCASCTRPGLGPRRHSSA